jgi:hypothetical protein
MNHDTSVHPNLDAGSMRRASLTAGSNRPSRAGLARHQPGGMTPPPVGPADLRQTP